MTAAVRPGRFMPGERYRITLDAEVNADGDFVLMPGVKIAASSSFFDGARFERTREAPKPPTWRPGDVVVVRYTPLGTDYTYVRGERGWPGERAAKTDAQMTSLFREGKARPVLQAGGEPFHASRLDAPVRPGPGFVPPRPRPSFDPRDFTPRRGF